MLNPLYNRRMPALYLYPISKIKFILVTLN